MYNKDNLNEILLKVTDKFPKKPTEFKWVNDSGTYCLQFPRSIKVDKWKYIDGIDWNIVDNTPTDIHIITSQVYNGWVDEVTVDMLDSRELTLLINRLTSNIMS